MKSVIITLLAVSAWGQSVAFPGPGISRVISTAITLVANTGQAGTANSVTTSAINSTGANFLAVCTTQFTAFGTLSDTIGGVASGNTWTKLTTKSSGTNISAIYYVANAAVGATHVFSVSGVSTFPGITVAAFSNVKTSSPFDVEASNATNGTTIHAAGAGITPSENNELVLTCLGDISGISTATIAISGYTVTNKVAQSAGASYGQSMAYLVQGTAALADPTWTWTTNNDVIGLAATFKAQ